MILKLFNIKAICCSSPFKEAHARSSSNFDPKLLTELKCGEILFLFIYFLKNFSDVFLIWYFTSLSSYKGLKISKISGRLRHFAQFSPVRQFSLKQV